MDFIIYLYTVKLKTETGKRFESLLFVFERGSRLPNLVVVLIKNENNYTTVGSQ